MTGDTSARGRRDASDQRAGAPSGTTPPAQPIEAISFAPANPTFSNADVQVA
jgi:hypothetical protein